MNPKTITKKLPPPEHFDRHETRSPQARDNALMRDLRGLLKITRMRAPALRQQLKGIDIDGLKKRADLACIPLIRKSDLKTLQENAPPFGGLAATRHGHLKRLLVSPGPIFEPEGNAKDWWGAGRALFATGIRPRDILLNTFSYHLTPGGHMMESGAQAIGAAVIPAGPGNTEQQLEAIAHYKPTAYCGTPDFLKILLDKAAERGVKKTSFERAHVSGAALPASLRKELASKGLVIHQSYGTADLGVVAYESEGGEGLIVNEGIILEIVKPGTGEPVAVGEVGEVVVTRLNADYPLLRFATGDLSALQAGLSPCGRTNLRIRGWMGRADQTTKVKGMFVHPGQISEIAARHPELGRLRLVVSRHNEQDMMVLHAERRGNGPVDAIEATLLAITKLRGTVEVAATGSLPNDGKVIVDDRPVS